MSRTKTRITRLFTASLVVAVLVLADTTTTTAAEETRPTSVNTADYDSQMEQLKGTFGSVASAMTAYYAANRGQALSAYLGDNPTALTRLSGASSATNLQTLISQAAEMKSPTELDALLIRNGVGLDVNSWKSLADASSDLKAKAQSIDATVVNAGMNWASFLTMLNVPSVKNPGFPAMETTLATSMPAEGLAFGMFMNKSLATLIGNFPDVFSQVYSSGVASPNANAAWRAAMQKAGGASYAQMRNVVGTSACGTAFVDGLTGTPGGGCSPCSVAGMYGNAQMQLAINGKAQGGLNPVSSVGDWAALSPTARGTDSLTAPSALRTVDQALNGTANDCTAAAPAVSAAATSALPKVVTYLSGR